MREVNQRFERLPLSKKGQTIKASHFNKIEQSLNRVLNTQTPVLNNQNLKNSVVLYIATETKGRWMDSLTKTNNSVVKCRPIRMKLYQEDDVFTDVVGEEVELTKLWDQVVVKDEIGIGVNMGAEGISFYSLQSVHQLTFDSWATVDSKKVLSCSNKFGTSGIYVVPAAGVYEDYWKNKTIGTVTYTMVDEEQRTATPASGPAWTEDLYHEYQVDEVINVIHNDLEEDNTKVVYRETGNNKIWVKTCT